VGLDGTSDQSAPFQAGLGKQEEHVYRVSRLGFASMNRRIPTPGCEHPDARTEGYHHRQPAFAPRAANADPASAIRLMTASTKLAVSWPEKTTPRCGAPLAPSFQAMVDTRDEVTFGSRSSRYSYSVRLLRGKFAKCPALRVPIRSSLCPWLVARISHLINQRQERSFNRPFANLVSGALRHCRERGELLTFALTAGR